MIKEITLTKDHIRLIREIKFEGFSFDSETRNGRFGWGIDQWNLFGGTYVLEDVSRILGRFNEHIIGTEEDANGTRFSEETEKYFWGLYMYIWENIEYIENLIHYTFGELIITPGTYIYNDKSNKIWTKK